MNAILDWLTTTAGQVLQTLAGNWPYLALSILVAALLKTFVNQAAVSRFLARHKRSGVVAATAAAVGTPLCSCGTTAVVLGMMAGSIPWAPIVAFLVASPLTSPQELLYSAGLFGWPFALTFFAASIGLGLLGGLAAHSLESLGWLANQARVQPRPGSVAQSTEVPPSAHTGPGPRQRFARELVLGGRQLLILFLAFAFVGYGLNNLIPGAWAAAVFGPGRVYGVPLAATLGVPFYFSSEASLPLVRTMLDGGMSAGAALAFLITGAGTSIGAVAGLLTIARWRVVGLVLATLWIGAVLVGAGYDLVRASGLL